MSRKNPLRKKFMETIYVIKIVDTFVFVVNMIALGRTWLLDESTFSTMLMSLIGNITVTRSRTCAYDK